MDRPAAHLTLLARTTPPPSSRPHPARRAGLPLVLSLPARAILAVVGVPVALVLLAGSVLVGLLLPARGGSAAPMPGEAVPGPTVRRPHAA